jgi:hypothetical protein
MRLLQPIIGRHKVANNNEESMARASATGMEMLSLLAFQSSDKVMLDEQNNAVTSSPTREKNFLCPCYVIWFLLVEIILLLIMAVLFYETKSNDKNNHVSHDWLDEQAGRQDNSSTLERCRIPVIANNSTSPQMLQLHLPTTPIGPSLLVDKNMDYISLLRDPQYSMTNICILQGSGLGSQLLNMIAQKIYFTDRERGFIVDDTQYGYKWQDNTTGVLEGFFTPKFPVLQMGEWEDIFRPQLDMPSMDTLLRMGSRKVYTDTDHKVEIMWAIAQPYRDEFPKTYGRRPIPLYTRFATEACLHLQFNERAKLEMKKLLDLHQIPSDLRHRHSVAFHVRRGDKIGTESKLYPGSTYVDKLEQVMIATAQLHNPYIDDNVGGWQ